MQGGLHGGIGCCCGRGVTEGSESDDKECDAGRRSRHGRQFVDSFQQPKRPGACGTKLFERFADSPGQFEIEVAIGVSDAELLDDVLSRVAVEQWCQAWCESFAAGVAAPGQPAVDLFECGEYRGPFGVAIRCQRIVRSVGCGGQLPEWPSQCVSDGVVERVHSGGPTTSLATPPVPDRADQWSSRDTGPIVDGGQVFGRQQVCRRLKLVAANSNRVQPGSDARIGIEQLSE